MITHFKGNRSPSLTDTIKVNGVAFDLTGSTVVFKMRATNLVTLKVNAAATVVSAPAGTVQYDWAANDVDTADNYIGWFVITLPGGKLQETPAFELVILDHAPAAVQNYIDREELKATLVLTGETYVDADIDAAVAAASRSVDGFCRRRFYPDADALQMRYYTPLNQWQSLLDIDDLITFTALATDSNRDGVFETTWTINTDFVLEPLNGVVDGEPFTTIRTMPLPFSNKFFWPFPRSVQVTGMFGWTGPPPEVIEATTILASRYLRRAREAPFGIVSVGLDGSATRLQRTDPDLTNLLASFVRGPLVA